MILRNGILSTLRARGRAVLFALLILLLTLALTLGAGMWAYCAQTLSAMDESYVSVALVEYMGLNYPEADQADGEARQAAQLLEGGAISALAGVELWEETDQTLASLSGYQRGGGDNPYQDYGVVVVTDLTPFEPGAWLVLEREDLSCQAILEEGLVSLYGPDGALQTQAPLFYYFTAPGWGEPNYFAAEILEDGTVAYDLVAEEELPAAYYLVSGSNSSDPMPGQYYGPGLGWNTRGYLGYAQESGGATVYSIYDPDYTETYTGTVVDCLYASSDQSETLILLETQSFPDFSPQRRSRYLLHGAFTRRASSNTIFTLTAFGEGVSDLPYQALQGLEDPALTEGIFAEQAAFYQMAGSYVRLEASDGLSALEPFQQGALYLDQGRFPQAGEAGVCVVDGRTAAQLGLSLGDAVEMTVLTSGEEDRFDLSPEGEARTLEVVGITNAAGEYSGHLWVSAAEGGFASPLFGYQLGRAVLDNARGRQAADTLQAMVPDGVRVTLYDQGWSTAAQPLQAMETTAVAVTAACACAALAVLFLFAYLFVGRQRETVGVLVSLGTPAGKIRLWLLSGAAVVAGAAALAGALAGGAALEAVVRQALSAAQGLYAVDQRYSEAAIGVAREVPGLGAVPRWPAAAAGLAVLAAALLLCLAFLRQARRQSAPKRGKTTIRVPRGGTSTRGRGPLRFALLSAGRGGWRSAVVPAAALTLALLLGVLASTAQGWSGQMDSLYGSAQIVGEATSVNGRQSTSLSVPARNARLLWESGLLSDLSVSIGWHYWVAEDMPAFSQTSFGIESRNAWIAQQPSLVALNSLAAAPAFYYGGEPEVTWQEGWDEGFLAASDSYSILNSLSFGHFDYSTYRYVEVGGEEWLVYPCLVSRTFQEARGLSLGEEFPVQILADIRGEELLLTIRLTVVGTYSGTGGQNEIYVPLSFWCDPAWITGAEAPLAQGERPATTFSDEAGRDAYFYYATSFSTCRFTLAAARQLEDLRDYLASAQFSQVGSLTANRTLVVLRDQNFVETVGGLGRYITFSRILLPALCGAVGLLGFLLSWLMVNGRRMEFAMMRGLGASRSRVFWSFFLEQAGLALLGCLLGGLLLTPLGPGWTGWLASAAFLACYLAGCTLAVLLVGRTPLMALLSERE